MVDLGRYWRARPLYPISERHNSSWRTVLEFLPFYFLFYCTNDKVWWVNKNLLLLEKKLEKNPDVMMLFIEKQLCWEFLPFHFVPDWYSYFLIYIKPQNCLSFFFKIDPWKVGFSFGLFTFSAIAFDAFPFFENCYQSPTHDLWFSFIPHLREAACSQGTIPQWFLIYEQPWRFWVQLLPVLLYFPSRAGYWCNFYHVEWWQLCVLMCLIAIDNFYYSVLTQRSWCPYVIP